MHSDKKVIQIRNLASYVSVFLVLKTFLLRDTSLAEYLVELL